MSDKEFDWEAHYNKLEAIVRNAGKDLEVPSKDDEREYKAYEDFIKCKKDLLNMIDNMRKS